jgi:hypothetical protein
MGRSITDIATVSIKSASQGTKVLETVAKLTVNRRDAKNAVKTMNPNRRAIGITRGVPDYTLDLEVVVYTEDQEVDWGALQTNGEYFSIFYRRNDGDSFACIDAMVADISDPYGVDGETRETVAIVFCDHRPEQ